MNNNNKSTLSVEYDCKTEYLLYTITDKNETKTNKVYYEHISSDFSEFEERNPLTLYIGIIWIIVGFYQLYSMAIDKSLYIIPIWFILGIIFLIHYWLVGSKYTMIDAGNIKLHIAQNKKHDAIKNDLYSNRNRYLKEKYGEIEFSNDIEAELYKFQWLLRLGVITQDEFDKINVELLINNQNNTL